VGCSPADLLKQGLVHGNSSAQSIQISSTDRSRPFHGSIGFAFDQRDEESQKQCCKQSDDGGRTPLRP
jgi:hypothetical protein